jgi:TPR repeat protein
MQSRLAFTIALASAGAGCSGGPVATVVPPATPKVGAVEPPPAPPPTIELPSIEACKVPERRDLLVVDWTPEQRADLEAAMKQGLALVSFDCRSLRLVTGCSLDGSYGYIGTTRREKQIELTASDEIAANLPVGSLAWLTELGGKLDRDSELLAQLVLVGKRASARKLAARGELSGSCDDVTHFVRAAAIGAFAVATGPKAELAAGAKPPGKGAAAGAKSATKVRSEDGDLVACVAADPADKAPPAQCGAIVRIELEPIGGPRPAAPELAVGLCAPGYAVADGACVPPSRPHQCNPDDADGCAAQCSAGDAASCATLAVLHRDGLGAPKDGAKAAALAGRACGAGVITGCRVFAAAKLGGEGIAKDPKAALALLEQACQAGDGLGCVDLGVARLADRKLASDAQHAFRRACYGGGEAEGCAWLGALQAEGRGGLPRNAKLAAPIFEKGCKEGSMRACNSLGALYKAGKGVKRDRARAKALALQACTGGYAPACKATTKAKGKPKKK